MAHASSEGCLTHWAGQSTKVVHGEESPSPTEDGGAVAGQGCCSAEHVRCLPCQQQRPRERASRVSGYTGVWLLPQLLSSEAHRCVGTDQTLPGLLPASDWVRQGCWDRAPPRRGSDALMVGLARWLWDGLGELSLEVHWDLRLSPSFPSFSLAFADLRSALWSSHHLLQRGPARTHSLGINIQKIHWAALTNLTPEPYSTFSYIPYPFSLFYFFFCCSI